MPILNVSANTYDPSGELTNDGTYTYGYNAEGQMTTQGGTTWTFDGNGNRVIKSDGTLSWPALDGKLLGNTNYYGTTYSNEYIYFNGARVATNATGNTVYYFFTDQIGSLKTVTTSNGTVCYDSEYTPEGYRWAYTSTCGQEFGLAGMKLDASTPTYRTLFREYAPNQGRWMSPDPLGGDVTDPQSLNRYAYVTNNPVALTDALGLVSKINDVCNYFVSYGSPCSPFNYWGGYPGRGDLEYLALADLTPPNVQGWLPVSAGAQPDCPGCYYMPTGPYQDAIWDNNGGNGLESFGITFRATSATTWTFQSSFSFPQTVQLLKSTGLVENPEDYVDIFHPNQLDLRDRSTVCSAHVDVDKASGQNGQPTTGDSHLDTINPWATRLFGPALELAHTYLDLLRLFPSSKACGP